MAVCMWLLWSLLSSLVCVALTAAPGDFDPICRSAGDGGGDGVLMDSHRYLSLDNVWRTVETLNGSAWTFRGNQCMQIAESCVQNETDGVNWLISQFIDFSGIPGRISGFTVRVELDLQMCTNCQNLNLYVFQTDSAHEDSRVNVSNYDIVDMSSLNVDINEVSLTTSNSGMYLALQDSGSCVTLNRLRVFYKMCVGTTMNFVQYMETLDGLMASGTCVDDATSDSGILTATCTDGVFIRSSSCVCESPMVGNVEQTACTGCIDNYFRDGNSCRMCPANSVNTNSTATICRCEANTVTPTGDIMTTDVDCSGCEDNYFRDGNSCRMCPANSFSNNSTSIHCQCETNRATDSGAITTTTDACLGCVDNYFIGDDNSCRMCPDNSQSSDSTSRNCQCLPNTVTTSGDTTTTVEACSGCSENFFMNGSDGSCVQCPMNSRRPSFVNSDTCTCITGMATSSGNTETTSQICTECAQDYFKDSNGDCTACPPSSSRVFEMNDEICPCDDGLQRKNMTNSALRCLPTVGFVESILVIDEGDSPRQQNIPLSLSSDFINVDIRLTVDGMTSLVMFRTPNITEYISVPIEGDTKALEPNSTITIVIDDNDMYIVRPFYGQIQVTIIEDDVVIVGFNESTSTVKQSNDMGVVYVERSGEIAMDMEIRVFGCDPDERDLIDTSVVFTPNGPSTLPAMFDIPEEEADDIDLCLEVVRPAQFRDQINTDPSNSNLQPNLKLHIERPAFPLAIVVAVIAVVGGALLLLIIVVLICICVCKWRISQQGYYTTYEDKASEPPSMLRYSASLRSISSQTVVPANESRSAAAGSKEHEFYV